MADKIGPAFHDWLSASAYVRGADQTARVVSKKKHRSKRNSGVSDFENERLEAEQKIRVLWKLSNRHYRRWMNDRLLRELAPPLDATEIGSLFAPPPWGNVILQWQQKKLLDCVLQLMCRCIWLLGEKSVASPFERISGFGEGSAHDVAAWEPFRNNVDMDAEANALQHRTRHRGKLGNNAALKAWQGVSHRSRDVLRRSSSWHLVNLFEEKILDFLKEMERGGSSFLLLDVDDAYHRMLIHGICEFHRLSSKTISNMEDGEGTETFTVIIKVNTKRRNKDHQQDMPESLMQFLNDANKRTCIAGPGA